MNINHTNPALLGPHWRVFDEQTAAGTYALCYLKSKTLWWLRKKKQIFEELHVNFDNDHH